MALMGKYVLIGEGARGSLAKGLIRRFGLDAECEPQKYGIGLKEIGRSTRRGISRAGAAYVRLAARDEHRRRLVPLPLSTRTFVSVGFVVHLNYENPYLCAVRGVPALQDA
jgi:electron-transferring-flavoprotein dehydrogenase